MRLAWLVILLAGCFPKHDADGKPIRPLAGIGVSSDEAALVHGVVTTSDPMLPRPLEFVVVELVQADKVIRETSTDHHGRFAFTGDIPAGNYEARVGGGAYVGATKLVVRSQPSDEVVIQARPK